ncbi:MAG TPA: hypothetical protein VFR84_10825 [Candidatus Angelobacter sp.]|nr:hypothetical protein [Candidatus Angelobacter sp.]
MREGAKAAKEYRKKKNGVPRSRHGQPAAGEMQSKIQAGARDLNLGVALAARSCLRAEGKMMNKIEKFVLRQMLAVRYFFAAVGN